MFFMDVNFVRGYASRVVLASCLCFPGLATGLEQYLPSVAVADVSGAVSEPGGISGSGGITGISSSFPQPSPAISRRQLAGQSGSAPEPVPVPLAVHEELALPQSLSTSPAVPGAAVLSGIIQANATRGSGDARQAAKDVATDTSQKLVDMALGSMEDSYRGNVIRRLNLSWTPGFAGRADLVQADVMISMLDTEDTAVLSQLGLQSRDNKAGGNVGLVGRFRVDRGLMLGVNAFYDHLSRPEVSRWSVGAEARTRLLSAYANWYVGMNDDRGRAGYVSYSPDGWDVEVAGLLPYTPWIEYSGRYYHWEGQRGNRDLKGADFKVTVRPMPLAGFSIRYDRPERGIDELGVELEMEYRIGVPWLSQVQAINNDIASDAWHRRFERVRREYEQRVQSIVTATGPSVTQQGGRERCTGACDTTLTVAGAPAMADHAEVIVTGRTGQAIGTVAAGAAASPGANSLLRVSGRNCDLIISSEITGVDGQRSDCDYDLSTSEITVRIVQTVTGTFTYDLDVEFHNMELYVNDNNTPALASTTATVEVEVTDLRGVISTAPGNLEVREGMSNSYTMSLASVPTGTVTITLTSNNSDVAVSPTPLTFNANNWSTAQTVTVTAAEDTDTTDDTAQLSYSISGGGYDGITLSAQNVTVEDNAAGISFSTASSTVAENGSVQTITINATPAPASTTTVNLTLGGTATVNTDYSITGLTNISGNSYSIDISANSPSVSFMVTPTDNTDIDGTRNVIFTITSGDNYTLGSPLTRTLSITDDDIPANISFNTASTTVVENGSAQTITIDATPAPKLNITVNLTLGGAATVGTDYNTDLTNVSGNSYSIDINAGSSSVSFMVTPIDNNNTDGARNVTFTIGSGTNYTLGSQLTHTLNITDDDIPANISFSTASSTAAEDVGSAQTITINANPAPKLNITVNLTLGGAATVGTDYNTDLTNVSGNRYSIDINAGNSNVSFTVTPIDNNDIDATRNVTFTIGNGTNYNLGSQLTHTLSITNDDVPARVSFSTPSTTAAENVGSAQTITINATPAPSINITVNLALGGSATVNSDYSISNDLTNISGNRYSIAITAGSPSASFMVTLTNDTAVEMAENITFTITSGTNYTLGSPLTRTLGITDDDVTMSFAASGATVAESASAQAITINSTPAPGRNITVDLTLGGTATVNTDYSITGLTNVSGNSYSIVMNSGSGSASFTIDPTADGAMDTQARETVIFTIGRKDSDYNLGTTTTYTLTITDDESAPPQSRENRLSALTITGMTGAGVSSNINIGFSPDTTTGYSATVANDVTSVVVTATLMDTTATMRIGNDDVNSGAAHTVPLDVVGSEGNIIVITVTAQDINEPPRMYTVTIERMEPPPLPRVSFSSANTANINEGDPDRIVDIEIDIAQTAPGIQLNVQVTGTATINSDYTISGLGNGNTVGSVTTYSPMITDDITVTIDPNDDSDVEEPESISITIMSVAGSYMAGSVPSYIVDIVDNDVPSLSFAAGSSSAAENASAQIVTINADQAPIDIMTVNLTLDSSSTATLDTDYSIGGLTLVSGNSYSIEIAPPDSSASFTIDPTADGVIDALAQETVTFMIDTDSAYSQGTTTTYTLTITDDEAVTPPPASTDASLSGLTITGANISFTQGTTTYTATVANGVSSTNVTATLSDSNATMTINGSAATTGTAETVQLTTIGGTGNVITILVTAEDGVAEETYRITVTRLPLVQFSTATGTVTEGSTASVATVMLSVTPTQASDTQVSVGVNTSTDTATLGVDYSIGGLGTPVTSSTGALYTVMLPANTGTVTVMLTVPVDDRMSDGGEMAELTIADLGTYSLGTNSSYTLTINDPATDSMPPGPVTGLRAAPGNNQVTLHWTNPTDTDFASVTLRAFTGGVGGTEVDISTGAVNPTPDGRNHLVLSGASGASVQQTLIGFTNGITYTFTVVAVDNDGNESTVEDTTATPAGASAVPVVTISGTASVNEGAAADITLTAMGTLNAALPVTLGVAGGATSGSSADYVIEATDGTEITGNSVTIPTSGTLTIRINSANDSDTMFETVMLTVTAPGDGSYTVGTASSATVTIEPVPDVQFAATTGELEAVSLGRHDFMVSISAVTRSNSADSRFTVSMTGSTTPVALASLTGYVATGATPDDGNILGSVDGSSSPITYTAEFMTTDSTSNLRVWYPVATPTVDDTITLTLQDGDDYNLGTNTGYTVTVVAATDNIPPGPVTGLRATAGNNQVTLNWTNPTASDFASVTISAIVTGVPGTAVDINGGSTMGNNLTVAAPDTSAVITAGVANGTQYTFTVVALDNNGNESTAVETRATPVAPGTPTVQFSAASGAAIAEDAMVGGNPATRTVNIVLSTPATGEVVVSIGAMAGEGFATIGTGNDYTLSIDGTITTRLLAMFSAGEDTIPLVFTPLTDNMVEGTETIRLELTGVADRSYSIGTPAVYTLEIEQPVVTEFTISGEVGVTLSEADTGTTYTITITSSNASPPTLEIPLAIGGDAVSNADYRFAFSRGLAFRNTFLEWTSGTQMQTMEVTVIRDSVDESQENITFTFSEGNGFTLAGAGITVEVEVTIVGDPPGPVTSPEFTPGNTQVMLDWINPNDADFAHVIISAIVTSVPGTPVDINGSAMGNDLTVTDPTSDATITGLTNDTEYTFTVVAVDNDGNMSTAVEIMATPAAPSVPMLTLTGSAVSVTEGQSIDITVATQPVMTVTSDTTVMFSIQHNTGASTADYRLLDSSGTALPGNQVVLPRGQSSVTFSLMAVDDRTTDAGETLTIILTDGTNYDLVSGMDTIFVTIADTGGTMPSLTIDSDAAVTIIENGVGTARIHTINIEVSVALTEQLDVPLTIAGTAATSQYMLTFPDGATLDTSTRMLQLPTGFEEGGIIVTSNGDTDVEPDQTITFTFGAVAGYTVMGPTIVTVTIMDDDEAAEPEASIYIGTTPPGAQSMDVFEIVRPMVTVTVALDEVAPTGGITVNLRSSGDAITRQMMNNDYAVSGLTTSDGVDYTLAIGQGVRTGTFSLTITNDIIDESNEDIVFTLRNGDGYSIASSANVATVNIVEPTVTIISALPDSIMESDSSSHTVSIETNGTVLAGRQVVLTMQALGSATLGTGSVAGDYGITVSGNALSHDTTNNRLVMNPGFSSGTVNISVVDDMEDDDSENIALNFGKSGTGYTIVAGTGVAMFGSSFRASTTIADDDDPIPMVSFSTGTGMIAEDASTLSQEIMLVISASQSPGIPVTVTATGSATINADYSISGGLGTGTTDGSTTTYNPTLTASVAVTITVINDGDPELTENLVLSIVAGDGYMLGTPSVYTLTIPPNDSATIPVITIASDGAATAMIPETDGSHEIDITADAALGSAVTIPLALAGDATPEGAVFGSDYMFTLSSMVTVSGTGAARTVELAAGFTAGTITVVTVSDNRHEENESVQLTFSDGMDYNINESTGGATEDTIEITVTITDDDPLLTIADGGGNLVTGATVAENAGAQTFVLDTTPRVAGEVTITANVVLGVGDRYGPVTLDNNPGTPDDITVSGLGALTISGTAPLISRSYTMTVEFPHTVTITINNDNVNETDESIQFSFPARPGYVINPVRSGYILNITDDDE